MTEQNDPCNLAAYEQRIREFLVIDETSPSGLRWNQSSAKKVKGKPAGRLKSDGYWQISLAIDRSLRQFQAHRVVWFLVHDHWPKDQIDHINCDRADNRIVNLREASNSENMRNLGMLSTNTSGVKGVSFNKSRNKWRARIGLDYKQINLGHFDNLADAERAVMDARDRLHGEFSNHGRK